MPALFHAAKLSKPVTGSPCALIRWHDTSCTPTVLAWGRERIDAARNVAGRRGTVPPSVQAFRSPPHTNTVPSWCQSGASGDVSPSFEVPEIKSVTET